MKVPMKWLGEYVDTGLTPKELAYRMTMAGLEAEKIDGIGELWDSVFVGDVKHVERHPNADRLVLADVEAGEHKLTVVTGAPNIAQGQKVALALAGARLYDGHSDSPELKTLKPGSIRGIKSEGMVCSEKELGLSAEHEGILVLPDDAPVGAPLRDYLGDTVIEFEITPNLAHAFSILGIAREAGALTRSAWARPEPMNLDAVPAAPETMILIEAPDLCYRYVGLLIEDVTVAPSPEWLARRLEAAGMRAINNIVDVTNYVMHEVGQPLHAFDYDTLADRRIIVRRAAEGEQFETLDHVERTLTNQMLVIADGEKPVGLAGVIGGLTSEVSDTTTHVLLESAHFDMQATRNTARALKVRTDASARFERGMDPALQRYAAARAAKLIVELSPGATVTAILDVNPNPPTQRTVSLPVARIAGLLGVKFGEDRIVDALGRLEFEPALSGSGSDRTLTVKVPTYRRDVSLPVDVIEEVARSIGYDELPSTLPFGLTVPVKRDAAYELRKSVRALLNSAGVTEAETYVTVSEDELRPFTDRDANLVGFIRRIPTGDLLRVINPLQSGRNVLRPTLVPSLIGAVSANLRHTQSVRLFEIASIFEPRGRDTLPNEVATLAIAIAGRREPLGLDRAADQLDFFDLKGVVERLAEFLSLEVVFTKASLAGLHPGRSAAIHVGNRLFGHIGEVHPELAATLGIEDLRLAVAELDLGLAMELQFTGRREISVPRFLPVSQDFAVVVDESTPADAVQSALRESAGPLVTAMTLFDIYRGSQLGEGKKSVAYRITFTAPNRTLTDDELVKVRGKIEKVLKQRVGGVLRA
jgi:phenylalanyl-tRNA synthetase beta chain